VFEPVGGIATALEVAARVHLWRAGVRVVGLSRSPPRPSCLITGPSGFHPSSPCPRANALDTTSITIVAPSETRLSPSGPRDNLRLSVPPSRSEDPSGLHAKRPKSFGLLSWGLPKFSSPPTSLRASTPGHRPRTMTLRFGIAKPRTRSALAVCTASTVCSAHQLAGLLHPAADHEVRQVARMFEVRSAWQPTSRSGVTTKTALPAGHKVPRDRQARLPGDTRRVEDHRPAGKPDRRWPSRFETLARRRCRPHRRRCASAPPTPTRVTPSIAGFPATGSTLQMRRVFRSRTRTARLHPFPTGATPFGGFPSLTAGPRHRGPFPDSDPPAAFPRWVGPAQDIALSESPLRASVLKPQRARSSPGLAWLDWRRIWCAIDAAKAAPYPKGADSEAGVRPAARGELDRPQLDDRECPGRSPSHPQPEAETLPSRQRGEGVLLLRRRATAPVRIQGPRLQRCSSHNQIHGNGTCSSGAEAAGRWPKPAPHSRQWDPPVLGFRVAARPEPPTHQAPKRSASRSAS